VSVPEIVSALNAFYLAHSSDINLFGINALLALSLYLTLACGLFTLANAAFLGVGAYAAALLTIHLQWPFPFVILAGGVAAALVSLPLGLPVLRLRGIFLAIATIGFGEAIRIFFVNWSYAGGALGLVGIPPLTAWWYVYVILAATLFIIWRLRRSPIRYAFEAARLDETAAQTMGINTAALQLAAFVAGAFICGIAGGLQAHLFLIVDPRDYGYERAVEILSYTVIGGLASPVGPVLGAGLITLLPEALRSLTSLGISPGAVRQFAGGVILLAVIVFLPGGLATAFERPPEWLAPRLGGRVKLKSES
jgi:branched-chain amino acid transport system permease protein